MQIVAEALDASTVYPAFAESDLNPVEILPEAACAGICAKPTRARRLSDKILIAFHQACDQREILVAHDLLALLESLLREASPVRANRRRNLDVLVAAHERLWHIRHSADFSFETILRLDR
jgi:hypothetical protein